MFQTAEGSHTVNDVGEIFFVVLWVIADRDIVVPRRDTTRSNHFDRHATSSEHSAGRKTLHSCTTKRMGSRGRLVKAILSGGALA